MGKIDILPQRPGDNYNVDVWLEKDSEGNVVLYSRNGWTRKPLLSLVQHNRGNYVLLHPGAAHAGFRCSRNDVVDTINYRLGEEE